MLNRNNKFKAAIQQLHSRKRDTTQEKKELTTLEKKQLLYQTRMYIFLQDLMEKVTPLLKADETIISYLPFTNEENSMIATSGLMGMTYTTTKEAKDYATTFNDLRGNRLLIFTNERMIFFTIIEFLEDQTYYSYSYESIKGIRLEKHKAGYFDWQRGARFKRRYYYWYTLDFQSDNHIFTEMLTAEDTEIFKRQFKDITKLNDILVDEHVHRDNKFDYIFSNIKLSFTLMNYFFLGLFILFLLILILGIFFKIGPMSYLLELNSSPIDPTKLWRFYS